MSVRDDNNQHPVDGTSSPAPDWLPTYPEYLADRYDRLAGGVNDFATRPAFFYDGFVTPDMLRQLGAKITEDRMLDGLTDRDANVVIGIAVITFPSGVAKMVRAIGDQMWQVGKCLPTEDNQKVVSALAAVLAVAYEISERL